KLTRSGIAGAPGRPPSALTGVALYIVAVAVFASMDVATKLLVIGLPAPEVMWARFGFHLLIMATALRAWRSRVAWLPHAPRIQIGRSLGLAVCNLLYALALMRIPLAEATAISFVGPVITVALAGLWLGEQVGWRRWCGVVIGLAGVLIVLRPGFGAVDPAAFFALASAGFYAVYQILTRRLAGVDTPQTTIVQTGLWATLATTAAMPFFWVWPTLSGWLLMLLLGALGGIGHYLLVLAYDRAPASLIAPMGYAGMIFAVLYGLLLFNETPGILVIVGALVIAAGGLLVISAERNASATPGLVTRKLPPARLASDPLGD
ncbi:MAG: DMT family transporter, partial [Acetobacteraceae bacterium]